MLRGAGFGRALFLSLISGCATGTFPSALSQRPLTLPAGEHQLQFAGGVRASESIAPAIIGFYRYGITDEVSFAPPILFSLGLAPSPSTRFSLTAGMIGLGFHRRTYPFNGDPRRPDDLASGFSS